MSPSSSLPAGSKLWLLDLGTLDIDASYVLSGANVPRGGRASQIHEGRPCLMLAALLYHPNAGLILFDTGSCEDIIQSWDREFLECAPRVWVKGVHSLPAAIKATGAGEITDVKAVVMSHLHLDHAGGLEHFFGTGYAILSFGGAILSPVVASYMGQKTLSWRWMDWIVLIVAGLVLGLIVFLRPETFSPPLLRWKAKQMNLDFDPRWIRTKL